MKTKQRIVINPDVMAGKPVIAGTRIPVDIVLEKLARNTDVAVLLQDYPRLTRADIQAVFTYARDVIKTEDVYPVA